MEGEGSKRKLVTVVSIAFISFTLLSAFHLNAYSLVFYAVTGGNKPPLAPTGLRAYYQANPWGTAGKSLRLKAIYNDTFGDFAVEADVQVASSRDSFYKTNLVKNSSFEEGMNGWVAEGPNTFSIDMGDNGIYPSSRNSLKAAPAGGAEAYCYTAYFIDVEYGKTYFFQAYVQMRKWVSGELDIGIDEFSVDNDWISTCFVESIQGESVQRVAYAYTPTSADVDKIKIYFYSSSNSRYTAYIDEVEFFEKISDNSGAKITICFDDGRADTYRYRDVMASRGIPITWFICSSLVCDNSGVNWYATWDQIKEVHDLYGWEIGNHSVSHPDFAVLSEKQIVEEVSKAAKEIAVHVGEYPISFAYPYGSYNNLSKRIIARYAIVQRGALNEEYTAQSAPYNDVVMEATVIKNTTSLSTVKSWVDKAIAERKWLVLVFHGIVERDPEEYEWLVSDFASLLDYIEEKRDAGQIVVTTLGRGRDLSGPDMWDQRVRVDPSLAGMYCQDIIYRGTSLCLNKTYYWRIRFIDQGGLVGKWSEITQLVIREREQPTPAIL